MSNIRIGIVGLGGNTRLRHIPGFRACPDVEIVGVCNRRAASTQAAAAEFGIPKTYSRWEDLAADPAVDAVMIGTWPYLHRDITVAALEAGKHVLTEARMARDATEAREMFAASRQHPELVTQIVPSPFGLRVHRVVKDLLAGGFLGPLREVAVLGINNAVADPSVPIHWRQSAGLSGLNMLALGILHETLVRWIPHPTRVLAQSQIFTPTRHDPATGRMEQVGTPDSVQILTEIPGDAIPGNARGIYHLSGAIHHGPGMQIHLYGSEGTLKYSFDGEDRVSIGRRDERSLRELEVPPEKAGGWRVEEEFINAIRGVEPVQFTDFATGVRYMEFTEAVAKSAASGRAVDVPMGE
ncbi:MAG: Gfo/Idh/MocA family oxidoreductase [Planctomycetota bacterium]|nr:Gfo/Idh/MocA family oxidoreductase [Planctomycetota bacterium]